LFRKAQTIDGRYQGARFGTAVVALGDLDKDGYAGELIKNAILKFEILMAVNVQDYRLLSCDAVQLAYKVNMRVIRKVKNVLPCKDIY
jgi:hypothetical protein